MWKRFVGFVWDDGPADPGYGVGITPPSWAGDPGYDRPSGGHPSQGLPGGGGHPSQGLPGGGHISTGPIYGGHPGNKPAGRPIIPANPIYKPPSAPPHPWAPGWWDIVDPGWGKPPILAFFPTDPGFGMEEGGSTPPATPDNSLPGGNWVATDPDYGIPDRCPGTTPHPPRWGWVPKPPDLSKPVPEPPTTATPK